MTSLKRRTFIKGFGLAMGLPLLDAMAPAAHALAAPAGTTHPRLTRPAPDVLFETSELTLPLYSLYTTR